MQNRLNRSLTRHRRPVYRSLEEEKYNLDGDVIDLISEDEMDLNRGIVSRWGAPHGKVSFSKEIEIITDDESSSDEEYVPKNRCSLQETINELLKKVAEDVVLDGKKLKELQVQIPKNKQNIYPLIDPTNSNIVNGVVVILNHREMCAQKDRSPPSAPLLVELKNSCKQQKGMLVLKGKSMANLLKTSPKLNENEINAFDVLVNQCMSHCISPSTLSFDNILSEGNGALLALVHKDYHNEYSQEDYYVSLMEHIPSSISQELQKQLYEHFIQQISKSCSINYKSIATCIKHEIQKSPRRNRSLDRR